MIASQQTKWYERSGKNYLSIFVAYTLLVATWGIIAIFILAFTEGWLAPWDTKPFDPSPDTWQFVVNDFFESGVGAQLPTLLGMEIK